MKTLLTSIVVALLAVCTLLPGCTVNPNRPAPTTQQISDELSLDVSDAVAGSIVFYHDPAGRARRITAVALEVKSLASGNVDISDLRSAMTAIVMRYVDPDDRLAARFFTDLIINRVKRRLGLVNVVVIPADKLQLARSLLVTACDSAIEAAKPYLNP